MFVFILFILGAIVGSFLNVVIVRLGTGLSIARGRSKCFSCGHGLVWYDLVPFFSYLFLGGKCRYCRSKISLRYFTVELVTAVLFAASGVTGLPMAPLGFIYLFLSLTLISLFVAMAFYDFRHKIIPDVLSLTAAIVSITFSVIVVLAGDASWLRLFAGLFVAFPFFFFWAVSRGSWMGFGDVKLALSIGWWLGLSSAFGAVFFAVFSGALVGVVVLFSEKFRTGRVKWGKHEIPFGPFLILGAFAAHFLGISIWTFLGV